MGVLDREYYRERTGDSFWATNTIILNLILVNVGVFFADQLFFDRKLSAWGGLRSDLFTHPWDFYRLLAYGFLHDNLQHIFWNMVALWFFGAAIEEVYGRNLFLRLALSLVVLSGLGWVIVSLLTKSPGVVIGASGAISGITVLFALHFPRRMIYIWGVLPVPAWLLVSLYLLLDLMGAMSHGAERGGNVAYACHLSGALFAFIFYKTGWTLASWGPRWSLGSIMPRRWFRGRNLKLYKEQPADEETPLLGEEVDRIQEKISQKGAGSLTPEEQRLLENASRKYQQRRRG